MDYSIEIYNPTENSINLGDYSVKQLSNDSQPNNIRLTGVIPSGDVFVISNTNAGSDIASETDMFDSDLNFTSKNSVELLYLTTTIDKVGNLDNDIEDVDLDFLQNLSIKRSRLVRGGRPIFDNDIFFEEWGIYPNVDLDDLGYHINSCMGAILYWVGATQLEPELEIWEWDLLSKKGTIASTEELDDYCNIFMAHLPVQYQPFDPEAIYNEDYTSEFDFNLNTDIVLPKGFEQREFDNVITVIDDIDPPTGDLGIGFNLELSNDCPADVSVDPLREIFDIRILDNETNSARKIIDSESINLFPTLAENLVTINSDVHQIVNIKLYGSDGKILKISNEINNYHTTLDLSDLQFSGFVFVHIETNEGVILKKIYKK